MFTQNKFSYTHAYIIQRKYFSFTFVHTHLHMSISTHIDMFYIVVVAYLALGCWPLRMTFCHKAYHILIRLPKVSCFEDLWPSAIYCTRRPRPCARSFRNRASCPNRLLGNAIRIFTFLRGLYTPKNNAHSRKSY